MVDLAPNLQYERRYLKNNNADEDAPAHVDSMFDKKELLTPGR